MALDYHKMMDLVMACRRTAEALQASWYTHTTREDRAALIDADDVAFRKVCNAVYDLCRAAAKAESLA